MSGCPRDDAALATRVYPDESTFVCGRCAGLWLPAPVVTLAIGRVPPGGAPLALGAATATALRCPDDRTTLRAIHHCGVQMTRNRSTPGSRSGTHCAARPRGVRCQRQ